MDVTVTENEGYIYKEGSLSYNGIKIENGCFIMPDEAVIITAEFEYNPNYFALKEKLQEAKNITFENYSADSFRNLQSVITEAQNVLCNHIFEETSKEQILNLENAINALKEKFVVSVSAYQVSTVYVGFTNINENLIVNVMYDNQTSEDISDYIVEGFDAFITGTQSITVKYGEFTALVTVDVCFRSINDTVCEEIADQIYIGAATACTPALKIFCLLINGYLAESVDYEVKYINNTKIGTAKAIVSGIGYYEGSFVTQFEIYCEHTYEVTEYKAPTCIENGFKTEMCSVCDDVLSYKYEAPVVYTENLPETNHNYANRENVSYVFTSKGAPYLDLLFSASTFTERNYDYIYIYDYTGGLVGKYSGNQLSSATVRVLGDTVTIKFTSDGSNTYYGFSLDSITVPEQNEEYKAKGHTFDNGICECETPQFDYSNDKVLDIRDLIILTNYFLSDELDSINGFNDDDGIVESADLIKLKKRIFESF